jgi:predicted DNA-binding transcriptional regulator AlpA
MSDQRASGQSPHRPVRCTARPSTEHASAPRKRAGSHKPCTSGKDELTAEDRVAGAEAGHPRWASDTLISIRDIRKIFKLGRTAAYELTRRPTFPEPVRVSTRCYRWWASEVDAFAAGFRRESTAPVRRGRPAGAMKQATHGPDTPPRRITGKVRIARTRREVR